MHVKRKDLNFKVHGFRKFALNPFLRMKKRISLVRDVLYFAITRSLFESRSPYER